jgi:glycosidase
MKLKLLFALLLISVALMAQEVKLDRVEPPSWWIGFKNASLQLLVHGTNIGKTTPTVNYPGVVLELTQVTENPNYLFINLTISATAKPGKVKIDFILDGKSVVDYLLPLQARKPGSAERKGFSSADVIYLVMPDRFANGDPSNDNVSGMVEAADRSNSGGRHGGDLKGLTDHADHLKNLGVTAVWCTPMLENNMEKYSYHGYSITDHYRTDPRFGSNGDYFRFCDKLHANGMKIIMDMVINHCGSGHWWMKDLPSHDWINEFPKFTRTNYRVGTSTDPYLSDYDSNIFQTGWFDKTMPDLNQHNPYLAKYLIQNSIWWIEAAGLDGIRLDTYPYSFKDFMAEWDKAVLLEYPHFNIVGECWFTMPDGIAYWQKDSPNKDGYNSYLPAVIDFAMYDALRLSFMEKDGWNTGIPRLYEILSQDFVYPDPNQVLTFADNHDVDRYLSTQGQDIRRLKMAMAFLLTSRGIPQIYYGTEALLTMQDDKNDGMKRADFPGGWAGDTVNAFTGKGLSAEQKDFAQYLQRLLNWRKDQAVIHTGKLTHYIPVEGVYVYFRHNAGKTVMVAMNNNDKEAKTIDRSRYIEFLGSFNTGTDVITGQKLTDLWNIVVPPESALILELEEE